MNGMNLSGKPGIVQPMQIPPAFGHPPIPLIQPRAGTLHLTIGPLQPSLTRHRGSAPYSVAKLPCSVKPARVQLSRVVRANIHCGRSCSSRSGAGAIPPMWRTSSRSIAVMLSGWAGQPGMQMIGRPALRAPVPAEVVGQAHRAGRVVAHRRDAAVGRAGPDRHDRRGLRRQPVDPLVDGDRLAVERVDAEPGPVAVAVDAARCRSRPRARARTGRARRPRRRTRPA